MTACGVGPGMLLMRFSVSRGLWRMLFLSTIVILGLCPEDLPACRQSLGAWQPHIFDLSKNPSFAAGRDLSLRFGLMLVSDEAPEATCLSSVCGSFRRPVRRFFPLHASLWQGGDGRRWSDVRPGAGPTLASPYDDASAWPVARKVPAGWCTIPTGTLARGMIVWPFAARRPSPPFVSPRCLGVRDSIGALSVCL
jgi:hypothetical protein